MIEIKNYSEEVVLKIINDAKAQNYERNTPHSYKVNTQDLDLICALLLTFNISVNVKEVVDDICDIEITFVKSNEYPKLTYVLNNIDSLVKCEASFKDLIIDDDMKTEIETCMNNIVYNLKFTET